MIALLERLSDAQRVDFAHQADIVALFASVPDDARIVEAAGSFSLADRLSIKRAAHVFDRTGDGTLSSASELALHGHSGLPDADAVEEALWCEAGMIIDRLATALAQHNEAMLAAMRPAIDWLESAARARDLEGR